MDVGSFMLNQNNATLTQCHCMICNQNQPVQSRMQRTYIRLVIKSVPVFLTIKV